jgi:hypothetical protein
LAGEVPQKATCVSPKEICRAVGGTSPSQRFKGFFIKNVLGIKKVVSLRPQKTFFSINHLKEGSVLK